MLKEDISFVLIVEKVIKNTCQSLQCKYTIEKYKTASKCMKNKIIKYLKENEIPYFSCKICQDIVREDHFDSKEHIDKLNSVCQIDIRKFKDSCLVFDSLTIDIILYISTDILKNILKI